MNKSVALAAAFFVCGALGCGSAATLATSAAPINQRGAGFAAFLDSLNVQTSWVAASVSGASVMVDWTTGNPTCTTPAPTNDTYCSSFVSAVIYQGSTGLKNQGAIQFLHPYNADTATYGAVGQCAPRDLLANRQNEWLSGQPITGPTGWTTLPDNTGWTQPASMLEAQSAANQGQLVVASYKYTGTPEKPGHIVVIHPAPRTISDIDNYGPAVTEAGATNAAQTDLKTAFKYYSCYYTQDYCPVGAWESMSTNQPQIQFFAHDLD